MTANRVENTKQYTIGVVAQRLTQEDIDAGCGGEYEAVIDGEVVDAEDLVHLINEYGITQPSSTSAHQGMWFSSVDPVHDRAYFEQGIHRYYSFFIKKIDGQTPSAQDYYDIAQLANITLHPPRQVDTSTP